MGCLWSRIIYVHTTGWSNLAWLVCTKVAWNNIGMFHYISVKVFSCYHAEFAKKYLTMRNYQRYCGSPTSWKSNYTQIEKTILWSLTQGTSKEHPRSIQGASKEHTRSIQGASKEHPRSTLQVSNKTRRSLRNSGARKKNRKFRTNKIHIYFHEIR